MLFAERLALADGRPVAPGRHCFAPGRFTDILSRLAEALIAKALIAKALIAKALIAKAVIVGAVIVGAVIVGAVIVGGGAGPPCRHRVGQAGRGRV